MRYTTISVSQEIKSELEKLKGSKDWNEFFKEIIEILKERKLMKLKELENKIKMLSEEEVKAIEEAIKYVKSWQY